MKPNDNKTRHTAEPWLARYYPNAKGQVVDIKIWAGSEFTGWPVCGIAAGACQRDGKADIANGARIAVCVNACAGMADPAAELADLRAQLEAARRLDTEQIIQTQRAEAQRDDLRKALEVCHDTLLAIAKEGIDFDTFNEGGIGDDAYQAAGAALARCEKGAK